MRKDRRGSFLETALWLAFSLIVLAIGIMALEACGISARLWGSDRCLGSSIAGNERLRSALARQQALSQEIERLEIALLDRPLCTRQADGGPLPPCPEIRQQPSEVVIALDTSLSMLWDFELDARVEDETVDSIRGLARGMPEIFDLLAANRVNPNAPSALSRMSPERRRQLLELYARVDDPQKPSRLEIAKESLRALAEGSPDDAAFTFATFDRCDLDLTGRRFAPDERSALLDAIDGASVDRNTALARTIAALPSIVTGGRSEDEPVTVILVADGDDNCGGDPCAAARELKSAFPYLVINAIAISRDTAHGQCIATATGGEFVDAADAATLGATLARAAGQDLPDHCR